VVRKRGNFFSVLFHRNHDPAFFDCRTASSAATLAMNTRAAEVSEHTISSYYSAFPLYLLPYPAPCPCMTLGWAARGFCSWWLSSSSRCSPRQKATSTPAAPTTPTRRSTCGRGSGGGSRRRRALSGAASGGCPTRRTHSTTLDV
jgi:hypothetical protein